jgi:hypothetical protein
LWFFVVVVVVVLPLSIFVVLCGGGCGCSTPEYLVGVWQFFGGVCALLIVESGAEKDSNTALVIGLVYVIALGPALLSMRTINEAQSKEVSAGTLGDSESGHKTLPKRILIPFP